MTRSQERQASPRPSAEAANSTVGSQKPTTADQPSSPTRSDKSSESEGKPVREKLKETRIDAQATAEPALTSDQAMKDVPNGKSSQSESQVASGSESERGRLRRKRSREHFEEDNDAGENQEKKHERHIRKKSRDGSSPKDSEADSVKPVTTSATRTDETSGSESDRGRLRRKRSHEDMEPDNEAEKNDEKKPERHTRKKSRDGLSPKDSEGNSVKPVTTPVTRIDENDVDESMASSPSERQATPENGVSDKAANTVASPKNKRTRDQAEGDATASISTVGELPKENKPVPKTEEERDAKRPRDKEEGQTSTNVTESASKILPGSGFANTSSTSPFAALSPKPQTSKPSDQSTKELPQTSDDKFKASGFGTFSNSTASPFGALGSSSTSSPFAAASGAKLASFASSTPAPASTPSGFSALGSSSGKSAFGGSSFGGTLGSSGFGGLGGAKSSFSSFATPGSQGITGLSTKSETAFGAPTKDASDDEDDSSDDEDGQEDESGKDRDQSGHERKSSQHLLSQQVPLDTGEEGEEAYWTGRAKLYVLGGETGNKSWQERGTGPFKLNINSQEEPKKARFVCRADGTHRLLLNAAVTKQLKFGDANGKKPKDGKIMFAYPKADGEMESVIIRMKAERAAELYDEVKKIQEADL